jgi:hypothetical protein
MAVEVVAATVVAAGGAGVGVASGVLDVLERYARLAGQGDEGVAEAVRGELVAVLDAGRGAESADETEGLGAVPAVAGGGDEDRAVGAGVEVGVERL